MKRSEREERLCRISQSEQLCRKSRSEREEQLCRMGQLGQEEQLHRMSQSEKKKRLHKMSRSEKEEWQCRMSRSGRNKQIQQIQQQGKGLVEARREYKKRLAYYERHLRRKPLHMRIVNTCMEQLVKSGDVHQQVRETVFLHVWAPALTEYVEWVLEEAVKSGKKRLYFLARDGYMMYLVARELVRARGIALEIRYLKISRFAIRNAEYFFVGRAALDTLCVGGIDISFEKVMKRANLTDEEALHIARLAGYTENYKTTLNYQQLRSLQKELLKIDQLFIYIKKHAQICYDTTVSYLKQEGLLEETAYALVDSGWIGTLQLSLQRVLEHEKAGKVRLQGYYFGLYERPEGTDDGQYKAFYFDEREVWRKVHFSNCLFETVFSAPEGMTLGYGLLEKYGQEGHEWEKHEQETHEQEKQKAVWEALESERKNPNAEVMECFAELMIRYISHYVMMEKSRNAARHRITENSRSNKNNSERVSFAEGLLKPLMGSPVQWEAEAFGELLFCDDVLESQLQPVAARWDERELRKQRFLNKFLVKMNLKPDTLHESAWAEGSIARLGKKAEKSIKQERLYKSFMYLRKAIGK